MRRFGFIFFTIILVVGLLFGKGDAYTKISGADAHAMYLNNEELIVIDVRDDFEYCPGHIPCAVHYSWNHRVFHEEYHNLPTSSPILIYCRSGSRSGQAAAILDINGYENVYSLDGGMRNWPGDTVTCDDPEDCDSTYMVYFPHIVSEENWETEISVINTSLDTPLSGTFKSYNADGELVDDTHTLDLPAAGRIELVVGDFFSNPTSIRYIVLETTSSTAYGYLKFYDSPGLKYRVAIPATTNINQNNISVSHIIMEDDWWTGLALVNTTTEDRNIKFTFNDGQSKTFPLPARAHRDINLADFLKDLSTENIKSAIISNAEGIIGLELFGNGMQLSGISLQDDTSKTLYYPHIVSNKDWWTGIAAFNPGSVDGELEIKPYNADGTLLSPSGLVTSFKIAAESNFIKAASQLLLPDETAWLKIDATVPINGFELFGTTDNNQLAGYSSIGIDGLSGIFPKNSSSGWTGLAIANTTSESITVTLKAYRDDGTLVATANLPLSGYQKSSHPAADFFSKDIDTATYITYTATTPVVAFQLNGSGTMLDALPGRQ